MPTSTAQPKSKETAKAAEAFALYVGMGNGRSLRKLADDLVRQKLYKNSASALRTIEKWSIQHNWQERLTAASTERAEKMLAEAADLDADTFLRTSQLLNERVHYSHAGDTDVVIKMRESVRKPMPKGGASVNVNVSVEVRHLAEQLASELGISADDLIAEAESIASREWNKAGKS